MFKVLLADDEPHILNYLKTQIPWNSYNLTVCGTASTGTEAYKKALEHQIDILITDIQMTGMDGLSLCEKLTEHLPSLQIIIISAYSDFSYAQRAIRLHVIGYCLKPLDSRELTGLIKSALHNLKQNITLHGDELLDIIETGDVPEIRNSLQHMGLNYEKYYIAASIHTGNIADSLNANLTIKLGKHKYLYLSSKPFQLETASQIICYCKKPAGIAAFPNAVSLEHLKEQITNTVIMAFQYFITGTPILSDKLIDGPLTEDLFHKLESSFSSKFALTDLITELKTANVSMIFNIKSAYRFYHKILHCPIMKDCFDKDEHFLYGYEQLITEYTNFNHLLDSLLTALDTTCAKVNTPDSSELPVSSFLQIIKYLNEHFIEDLSLQQLADHFHMNASYISFLIKKETGLTYSQYLTNLRITTAKELLSNPEISLTEVSESVGFHDYFYFIKKFKKSTGVTPGYYQKNHFTFED